VSGDWAVPGTSAVGGKKKGARKFLQLLALNNTSFQPRGHDAVIRVYDEAGNVIETHEHPGEFKEW
jgi:hypothetical protein